jgi:hypothetical protein
MKMRSQKEGWAGLGWVGFCLIHGAVKPSHPI